jgi:KUP system potassium uptake protein
MVLWFVAIGAIGAREVAAHPDIVRGLAPSYAIAFIVDHPGVAFVAMGAVMLAITGAEALYATWVTSAVGRSAGRGSGWSSRR